MTRGSQRDRDRERAQARVGGKQAKGKNDGLTPEQRRERSKFSPRSAAPRNRAVYVYLGAALVGDAKALQEKTAKKSGQQAGGTDAAGGSKK